MKKMTLKMLFMSVLMLLIGFQSFANTTNIDSVYVLASNNIKFSPTINTGDSVGWMIDGTFVTTANAGITFDGTGHSILKIEGNAATGFIQPSDSITAQPHTIKVIVYNAAGCYAEDTSVYQVLVLPTLKIQSIDYDSIALCSQSPQDDSMTITQPDTSSHGYWSTVKFDNYTWYKNGTQITSGGADGTITQASGSTTSKLKFTTPGNTTAVDYTAKLSYSSSLTIITGSTPLGSKTMTSYPTTIQAEETPTAPTLGGSTVSGW